MKKILGLTIAGLLVIGMVSGAAWAYFSDVETVADNEFVAGTLDLGLSESGGGNPTGSITGTFDTNDWAPGSTVNATIYVNNEGSIAMTSVNVTFSQTYSENTPSTVTGWNDTDDSDNLTKMLVATTCTWNGTTNNDIQGNTLEYLVTNSPFNLCSFCFHRLQPR